jgi:uncharacterized repeat protein (TIGR03803 family)
LVSFDGANGRAPNSGLIADLSGTLYGTTANGGANDKGTVFSFTSGGIFTTLASFDGANGESPFGGLLRDASGTLFGTTVQGGVYRNGHPGFGTVFSLTAGGAIVTLASFDGANGAYPFPQGGLFADALGRLYGTTYYGGAGCISNCVTTDGTNGTVFRVDGAGFVVGGVPEPASWALLIIGFGIVGVAARYRSRRTRSLIYISRARNSHH